MLTILFCSEILKWRISEFYWIRPYRKNLIDVVWTPAAEFLNLSLAAETSTEPCPEKPFWWPAAAVTSGRTASYSCWSTDSKWWPSTTSRMPPKVNELLNWSLNDQSQLSCRFFDRMENKGTVESFSEQRPILLKMPCWHYKERS